MTVREPLREEFRRSVEARSAGALRALLEREPSARALLDLPLFSFGTQALNHVAGDPEALDLVETLLQFGADPNRRSEWWAGGFHPLHSARGAVAERLLSAGAVPDACGAAQLDRIDLLLEILERDPARVHERGGDGQTPLHFARSEAVADLVIQRGAGLDARDRDHRATPAEWMLGGRDALARHLVSRGATADIFLASALGLTDRIRAMLEADPTVLAQRTGQGDYGEQPPSSFHIYTWTLGQNLSPLQVAAKFGQEEARAVLFGFASDKERFLDACSEGRAAEARALLRAQPQLMDTLTAEDHACLPNAGWAARVDAVALMLELGIRSPGPRLLRRYRAARRGLGGVFGLRGGRPSPPPPEEPAGEARSGPRRHAARLVLPRREPLREPRRRPPAGRAIAARGGRPPHPRSRGSAGGCRQGPPGAPGAPALRRRLPC